MFRAILIPSKPSTAAARASVSCPQTVVRLVRLFQPLVVIVFGRTNSGCLAKHLDESVSSLPCLSAFAENGSLAQPPAGVL